MNYEVVVSCAVTGAGDTTGRSPHVPVTPKEVADAAIQAEIMKAFQPPPQAPVPTEEGAPQPEQAPAGADAQDQTVAGGGNIGTGVAPAPGEQGFSGNVA